MKHLPKKLLILGGLSIGVLLLWICTSRFNQLKRTNINDLNHLQSLVSQRHYLTTLRLMKNQRNAYHLN